jgi:hypothetical protein
LEAQTNFNQPFCGYSFALILQIAVELAILRTWQEQFPTDEEDEQRAQQFHKERLQSELIFRAKKNGKQR